MHVQPNYNKDNKVISYRFMASGKDPFTGNNKLYTKTWKIPQDLTNKEIKKQLKVVEIEFATEVEKTSKGMLVQQNNIKFKDFANEWLDDIIKLGNDSYTYYTRAKGNLAVILPYFGECLLKDITPMQIKNFYTYLSERTYLKQTATVKKSVLELEENQKINKTKVADDLDMARLTLRLGTTIGERVNIKTARTICKHFNVPLNKYFDITTIECKYSKATNANIRTTLVMILGNAKRMQLIEDNYATKEYNKPITGKTSDKQILNEEELQQYIQLALKLDSVKHKLILLLPIMYGLRRCEIAGLKWDNINFKDKEMYIEEDVVYTPTFGVKSRGTKTKCSKRTLCLSDTILNVLSEYKVWYDEQKFKHGDKWANNNHLFLQENGNTINPCTLSQIVLKFEALNGLSHVSIHLLRHTYISYNIIAGNSIKVVSAMAGHSSEKITLGIYAHSVKSQEKLASDKFDNFLKNINKEKINHAN